MIKFPKDFQWGVATASYQIEGAWNIDGKGESIWDRFSHTPGRIVDKTNGDIACDFYNRYGEDIEIAAKLGIKVFRLSISWSRVMPNGVGEVSKAGIDYYKKVLQCLHDHNIKSAVTIYHWDLPQALQDRGGWGNREITGWYTEYAKLLYRELGDLVDSWITFNEPYVVAFAGNWSGEHAPGYRDYSLALSVAHHQLLSHGYAVKAYRATSLKAPIGITLNMSMFYPHDPENPDDVEMAKICRMQKNDLFAEPVMKGTYPKDFMDYMKKKNVVLPKIMENDMEIINQKTDFFGLNSYYPNTVQYDKDAWPINVRMIRTGTTRTEMDWEVNPQGLYELLMWIKTQYAPENLIITENGVATNDWLNPDGKVYDPNRQDFLERYLTAIKHAIDDGLNITGYYLWSYTDNFEWACGKARRFGLVYIDYESQKRVPKESAYWYSNVIKNNGF